MSDIFQSIFSSIDAVIYRCKNDSDYTMDQVLGSVSRLLGYRPEEIEGNSVVSWVDITAEEDRDRVTMVVDAAIDSKSSWDVAYRIVHKDGHRIWVRERGAAVFENDELMFLEGMVVSAAAEVKLREKMEAMLTNAKSENSKIVELTSLIAKSLQQLSMLAINARIEAARSGDAGKGFGVVSEAIDSLAKENTALLEKVAQLLRVEQDKAA